MSSVVPKPGVRSSKASASKPSLTPSTFPLPPCAHGSSALPPLGARGSKIAPVPVRPPTVTGALAPHLDRLVAHDPLQHGSSHSPWRCQALATVLAQQTGSQLRRASVREV